MKSIVGFEFNEINAKKVSNNTKIEIKQGINITSITPIKSNINSDKTQILKIGFNYNSIYSKTAAITIKGNVFVLTEKENANEIAKEWKEKKRTQKDLLELVINTAFTKCIIESISISQKLNLPPPIPFPKITVDTRKVLDNKNNNTSSKTKKENSKTKKKK